MFVSTHRYLLVPVIARVEISVEPQHRGSVHLVALLNVPVLGRVQLWRARPGNREIVLEENNMSLLITVSTIVQNWYKYPNGYLCILASCIRKFTPKANTLA